MLKVIRSLPLHVLGDVQQHSAALMGSSFSKAVTNVEQLAESYLIFPLLCRQYHTAQGRKKKQNKKRLKSPLLKRFISKCSRAMLALHIFSCSPKAAHVRYFLSFMLLTGMHHEVQICNLLSVLVIRHDFLCLLMRAAAKCSLL